MINLNNLFNADPPLQPGLPLAELKRMLADIDEMEAMPRMAERMLKNSPCESTSASEYSAKMRRQIEDEITRLEMPQSASNVPEDEELCGGVGLCDGLCGVDHRTTLQKMMHGSMDILEARLESFDRLYRRRDVNAIMASDETVNVAAYITEQADYALTLRRLESKVEELQGTPKPIRFPVGIG